MPLTTDLQQSDPICDRSERTAAVLDYRKLKAGDTEIEQLRTAALETGYLVLNDVFEDPQILANTLRQIDVFFALEDNDPRKQRVKISSPGNKNGWTPMFGEPAYQPGTIAHLESFDCGNPDGAGTLNRWPDIENFRRDVQRCWNALSVAGDRILESLATVAGVSLRTFADQCDMQELSTLRLLHYPGNDAPVEERNVGIAAHTDFECITLLMQTASGLELRNVNGNWYDLPSSDEQVVVLFGDMLERLTNGFFQATGHRVRNTCDRRFSIVMFIAVNDDVTVRPLSTFTGPDNHAKYPAVTQRDHLRQQVEQAERYRDA